MLKQIIKDKLTVKVFENRALAGKDAARDGANAIRELQAKQEWVNIIFAAAPSQNDTLAALFEEPGIDWTRCRAFHMDEYVGFPKEKKESFGNYLYEHVFGKLPFGEVHYVGGDNPDPEAECQRYGDLLTKYPTDIVFLGIGENAHIAFNDPPADFNDNCAYKVVTLAPRCLQQQVGEGWFTSVDDAYKQAISMTCPQIMKCRSIISVVPYKVKSEAVYKTLTSPLSPDVPATLLKQHADFTLYCDADSAEQILSDVALQEEIQKLSR